MVVSCFFFFFIFKTFEMFYQEKHPGEEPPHLFRTNKHDLLVITLLFRRQVRVPNGFSDHLSSLGVSVAQQGELWLQKTPRCFCYGSWQHRDKWTGNLKITVARRSLQSASTTFLETFVRTLAMAHGPMQASQHRAFLHSHQRDSSVRDNLPPQSRVSRSVHSESQFYFFY